MGKTKMKVIVAFIAVIAVSLLAVCFGHLFSYSEAKAADGATYDDSAAVALLQDIADDGNATLTQDVVIDLTVSSRITGTLGLNGYMDIDDDTTINLGGHTLKIVTGSTNCCVEVAEGKTLEIKGSGSFIGESGGDFAWGQEGSSISISATATVDFTYNEDAPGSGGTEVDVPTDDENGTYLVRSEGTVTFIKNWSGTTTTLVSNIPVAVKTGDCVTDYGTIRVNEDKIYSNSLSAAVLATDSDDDTVYLLNDVTGSIGNQTAAAELLNGLTIDLQGNTLKSANGNAPTMRITTSGDLTIKNGKINPSANAMFDITAAKNAEINVNISDIIAVNGSGEEHAEITGSTPPVYSVKFDGSESTAMNVVVDGLKVDLAVPNAQHSAGVISAYGVDSLKITDSSLSIRRTPESGVTGTEIAVYSNASNVSITRSELSSETGAGIIFLGDMMADAATNAISDTSGYYTLDFSDSSVTGGTFGISGNGSNSEDQHYSGTVINVKDSTVKGGAAAPGIYQPQVGILNVSGTSKISGSSGIEIRAGKLNVEDGEIIATSTELTTADKPGEGSSIDGAAIAISQHSTDQPIEVTISDGTFIGPAAVYEKDLLNETGNDDIAADLFGGTYKGDIESENMPGFISGGEFDGMLSKDYLSEGSAFYLDEKGNIKVADENSAPEGFDKVVAMIGDAPYASIAAAVTAAGTTETTIVLYDDVTESVTVAKDDTITLDLNGNTITNAAGQHTITNNGTLTIVGTGTVDNVSHARGAIVNYGEAYLNGGTFTRSAERGTYGNDSISGTYSANGNSWYTVKNYGYMQINGAAVTTNTSGTFEIGDVSYPTGGYSSLIANGYQNAADYNNNHSLVTGKEATLDIVNGTFSGGINTVKNDEHSVLSISGGKFENTTQHTVLNYGDAKISGGVFNAPTASAAVWTEYYDDNTPGTLTVTGGDLNGGQFGIAVRNGAKTEVSGTAEVSGEYAIIVDGAGSLAKVSGGSFEGAFFGQPADTLSVAGGTFDSEIDSEYIADDALFYQTETGYAAGSRDDVLADESIGIKYICGNVGYKSLAEATADGVVALIGDKGYKSLAEAMLAVPTYNTLTTIELVGGENGVITARGVKVQSGQNVIIDFNGLTYNVTDTVGSSGTETNGFQLNKGSTVKMMNGTIVSDTAKILLQKYNDLTLENMTLDMTESDSIEYVISNNNGTTTITGNTVIKADTSKNQVAFDVYYWPNNGYGTVSVIFDENFTGEVSGKIEYASDGSKDNATWFENAKLEIKADNTAKFDVDIKVGYTTVADEDDANITVSGGTFKSLVNEAYIADASLMYSDGDGYVVGNYDTVIQNPPATVKYVIGNIGYSTIEEAMAAGAVAVIENTDGVSYAFTSIAEAVKGVSAGDVIKLVADTEETAFTIDKENITIDIAGFNVTTDGMISINADGITVTDSTAADGTRGGTVSGSTSIFSVNEALGVTIENINIKTTSDDADIRINTDHVNMTSADKTGLTLKNVCIEGNNGIYVFTFNKSVANDGNTYVELNIVDSEIISAQYYGIAGNGVNHGTVINVVDSDITVNGDSGLGIYHPQCGVLTISGNSYIKAANGIEMRAGTLNIADAGVTVESTATEFSTTPNGNGTTLSGIAIGISQHTTNLPVAVNISGGTYIAAENCYALYEADLQDTDYTGISVSINGGTFEGAVKSEDLTGFIHSGKFAVAPDADAFAEGYGGVLYNGYYVVVKEGTTAEEIAGNITSAKSEVRVYAAIYGLTMSKIEALADAGDADAMAIVTAYAAIEERPTDTAEALAAVLDAIDAYVTNLEAYKEEAIAELQACAELNNVASPTATYASIRNAKTKAEVDEYMEYAFYEIVYLTHLRSDVMTGREKLDVLEDKLDALLSAGAGDVDMNELLADIRELISGAEDSILSGTSDQLADLKEDIESAISKAQTAIESAISEIRTSLDSYDAELEALSGKLDSLTGALSDLGESIGADIDEVLASIAEIKASIGTDDSAEIIAAIEELKAALADIDTAVGDISASVSTAVDVEEAKTNATADLESWLNSYLDNIIKTSAARGTIVAYAAELTEDSELYGKLEEAFGKDNASLILKYYNDAMTSIENATSVSDVTSAVSTFKSQVASIEASTQNTPTLTAVYVLLAIILAVVIIVVIIMIVLMVTRKKEAKAEQSEEEPVAATETSEEAEKQPEESVAEEQPEEPAAEEEVKEEAAEEPAEEAKAEQPEEELGDDRERVVITASVRTFDEAYEDLSEDLKDLFVRLKEYALTKEGTTEVKLSNGVCIKHGSRKVIRLTVRRGYPVAMFVLENEMLKDVRRNAASTLKLKIPATELVIRDETDFYAASTMIDFTMDQILKDIEEAKERRKAARRARRQQKREEEAGETGTAPAADAEDNAPTD